MKKKKEKLVSEFEEEDKASASSRSLEIPDDTIENILSRLPVKSLLRFKAVCKSWARTICDPRFANIHLHHSRRPRSPQHYLLMWYADGGPHVARYENRKTRSAVPYPWSDGYLDVCCFCDGLVLKRRDIATYVLWNPSARSHIEFECPRGFRCSSFLQGLCYDDASKDYKVVIGDGNNVAIFHCRSNRWSIRSNGKSSFGVRVLACRGVPFGCGFYWVLDTLKLVVFGGQDVVRSSELAVFDSGDETLYRVPMPSFGGRDVVDHTFVLKVLGGRLCLVCYNHRVPSDRIWCMVKTGPGDSSWVEIDEALPFLSLYVMPVFLTNEDEMILDVGDEECFVVCDQRRMSFEKVEVSSCGGLYPRSVPCLENLFLSCPNKRE